MHLAEAIIISLNRGNFDGAAAKSSPQSLNTGKK